MKCKECKFSKTSCTLPRITVDAENENNGPIPFLDLSDHNNCWEHWFILLLFESWKKDFEKSGLDWNGYLKYLDALNLNKNDCKCVEDNTYPSDNVSDINVGKWIDDKCSECGYGVQPWNNTPFCPNCGADM